MKLSTYGTPTHALREPVIGRISTTPVDVQERMDTVLAVNAAEQLSDLAGYAGVLITGEVQVANSTGVPAIIGLKSFDHLHSGDVVIMQPTGLVRTLYRKNSRHNVVFATDRCDSLCLMCSQPPRDVDDSDRIKEHLRLVALMDPETTELGITGGEPTLLGVDFLRLIEACKNRLPQTALHVLTNGRAFRRRSFAKAMAEIRHPDLMLGVPLYSDLDWQHDYVVQAKHAFDETLVGLHNLATYGVRVEIRVVIHQHTYERLPELAEFIYRNMPFAAQVAFMGLEMMGFAITNKENLWIDPFVYRAHLSETVQYLAARSIPAFIYNHQLCTLPQEIWKYSRRTISDWKQQYLPLCDHCAIKDECGGFFTSTVAHRTISAHISPITVNP